MKIIFADETEIEVKTIYGMSQRIQNADRDVLIIEIDPNIADTEQLRDIFTDKNKTRRIRTSTIIEEDESISDVGNDYTLYLSVSNERREVHNTPGEINAPEWEIINIVKIAQLTYMEKMIETLLSDNN